MLRWSRTPTKRLAPSGLHVKLNQTKDTDNPDLIQMIVVGATIEKACGD